MSELERLLNAMNLKIETNKTITKVEGGIKSTIQYNNKPIITNTTAIGSLLLKNRNQYMVFNTYSESKDCIYLFLEQYIHEVLSSKISFIVSSILEFAHNPELYNNIKSQNLKQLLLKLVKDDLIDFDNTSENSLLNKWLEINKKMSEKLLQDGLISLSNRLDDVCIEDDEEIEYYKKIYKICDDKDCIFTFFSPYTAVEFSVYNLLKQSKNQLLGVKLEKNEVDTINAIYQYIFKDIDKKNAYSSLNNSLLEDKFSKSTEKVYIVNKVAPIMAPTMLIIESFNMLATHIDSILDDMVDIDEALIKNEKFNLNLTKDEISKLRLNNDFSPNYNFGSANDFRKEIKLNPRIKFEEFNTQVNEALEKDNKKVPLHKQRATKRRNYQNFGNSIMPLSLPESKTTTSLTMLEPDNVSFEQVIPEEERKRNTHIIANSGAGKSTILKTFISKDLKEGNTVVVMDPDGEFAEQVAQMVEDPSKLVFIDPYAKKGETPTINPLQIIHNDDENVISSMTQELVVAFENGIGLEWSVNMEAVLYPCISTLIRKGNSDIYELQRFMNNDYNQDLIELGKKSPIKAHREFFQKQFHQEKLDVTKDALGTKLQVLLNDPVFANLVTGDSTINLEKKINSQGKVIVFKFSIGEMVSTLTLFSRLIMALIQGIIFRRKKLSQNKIYDTHLYLDEFQHFVSPSITTMLTQSRKKKCYTTLAHQTISGQLSKKMQDIVASCTHYKLAGQNSYENHKIMSNALQVEIDTLQNLENGCFISKVGANPYMEIKYSDKFIGNNASVVDDKEWDKYLKYQIEKYYRPIEDESLDTEINSNETILTPKSKEF